MTIQLGILLALLCAVVSNLGFFFKHRGACEAPPVDIRHPFRTARALYSSKWFALGMIIATSAWGFHVAALAMAPMSVVQVVLAGGVVLIAVMADRIFGFEVGLRQWAGLGLTATGLVLLAVTLPTAHGAHSAFNTPAMIAFEAGLFFIGGLLIMGPRAGAPAEHHGVMLGAASGVLFGVSDVAIKALTHVGGVEGITGILISPWLLVTLVRLGRRVLRVGPRPAGRRRRPGHRDHGHRRERLLHRRRHHRLRRPAPRRRARHRRRGGGVHHDHRRLRPHPGPGPLRGRRVRSGCGRGLVALGLRSPLRVVRGIE